MPPWDPWPGFLPPPEYASKRGSDLLQGIVDLAQAVPPSDPNHTSAQAALQRAQDVLGQPETDLAALLRRWGRVACAYRLAETGNWDACRTELDTLT